MSILQGERSYLVSRRGQLSLPADARHRWGLDDGGRVDVFDLGESIVILPGGDRSARRSLAAALTADRYARAVAEIDDPDLQDQ